MTEYREAAHAAFQAVDQQEALLPCQVPANNLVYQFLVEARKVATHKAPEGSRTTYLPTVLKKAADHVKDHPLRIYDADSAKAVPHIGPDVAQMIMKYLFSEYSQEAPSFEEMEERRAIEASLRKQANKRKALKAAGSGLNPELVRQPGSVHEEKGHAECALKRRKAATEKQPKTYIPKVGTANYAFLITLLQATKGPEKRMYLTKQELMDRAEASGLADKSIQGEGNTNSCRGAVNPSQYYNGWSGFNSQLVNAHRLVSVSSNPKKCELMPRGLDLAEQLYRHAVQHGKMSPIPGIPTEGEFLFKLPDDPDSHILNQGADASLPAGAGGHAAAIPRTANASKMHGGLKGRGASTVPRGCAHPIGPPAPPSQASAAQGLLGSTAMHSCNPHAAFSGRCPPGGAATQAARGGPRTGAAAIADALAQAGRRPAPLAPPAAPAAPAPSAYRGDAVPSYGERYRSVWDARHTQPGSGGAAAPVPSKGPQGGLGAAAVGCRPASEPAKPAATQSMRAAGEDGQRHVISLLDDEDDEPPPLAARLAGRYEAANGMQPSAVMASQQAVRSGVRDDGAEGDGSYEDVDLEVLVEMGYKERSARKALRRSLDVNQALDLLENLGAISDSDTDGSDADFHDAQEALPLEGNPGPSQPEARSHASSYAPRYHHPAPANLASRSASLQRPQPNRHQTAAPAPPLPTDLQPAHASQGYHQDIGLGGSQGQGSQPPRVGHIRLGSQQGDSGRVRLGSQPQGPGLHQHGSQPEAWSQPEGGAGEWDGSGRDGTQGNGPAGESSLPMGGLAGSFRQQGEHIRLPPITPGRCFKDEYEVLFLVDGREQYSRCGLNGKRLSLADHLDSMRLAGMRVEKEQLRIGDALWVARSRSDPSKRYLLDFIVERKSVEDLIQSIRTNGRYEKQKLFLRKCGLRYVKYLLEGDPDLLATAAEQKTVKTAMSTAEVFDRFQVLRTRGHSQTFKLYQALTGSIERLYGPLAANSAPQAPLFEEWDSHMKRVQSRNTTLHDVWGLMLTAVPGLGPEAVQIILQHYSTPHALYMRYSQIIATAAREGVDPDVAVGRALAGLRRGDGVRSIGLEKSQKVFQMLFASM